MSAPERVLVVGGVFDPPHVGHVAIVRHALAHVDGATRCIVVVTAIPPHRRLPRASAEDRLAMARATFADEPGVEVSDLEVERARDTGAPTWTVDTVERIVAERPGVRPVLVLGADRAASFTSWHRWRDLLALADLCIVTRPGGGDIAAIRQRIVDECPGAVVFTCEMEPVDVSATMVRELVTAGRLDTASGLVAPAIAPMLVDTYVKCR